MSELSSDFQNLDNFGEYYKLCQITPTVVEDVSPTNRENDGEVLLSASILGTPVEIDGTKIEDYFDDDVRILKYCLARIDEIEMINRFSHTPSAYTCILSFLAFLAQATANASNLEEDHFKSFCNKHLLRLKCKCVERTESGQSPIERTKQNKDGTPKPDVNTWGEVLYKLLRCGLVHSLSSSGNRDQYQNEVEIRLTHDKLAESELKFYSFSDLSGVKSVLAPGWKAVTLVVSAFDLITAIKDSILHIYTDSVDAGNIRSYFKCHPPLMQVVDNSSN